MTEWPIVILVVIIVFVLLIEKVAGYLKSKDTPESVPVIEEAQTKHSGKLDVLGVVFLVLGIIGAVLFESEYLPASTELSVKLAFLVQGLFYWVLLKAGAEALRLLRDIKEK